MPLQKIVTIVIRTFSKPMLSYMRRKHEKKELKFFNWIFIWLGRKYNQGEQFINNQLLRTQRLTHMPELKEEIALEKGIEAFY